MAESVSSETPNFVPTCPSGNAFLETLNSSNVFFANGKVPDVNATSIELKVKDPTFFHIDNETRDKVIELFEGEQIKTFGSRKEMMKMNEFESSAKYLMMLRKFVVDLRQPHTKFERIQTIMACESLIDEMTMLKTLGMWEKVLEYINKLGGWPNKNPLVHIETPTD